MRVLWLRSQNVRQSGRKELLAKLKRRYEGKKRGDEGWKRKSRSETAATGKRILEKEYLKEDFYEFV